MLTIRARTREPRVGSRRLGTGTQRASATAGDGIAPRRASIAAGRCSTPRAFEADGPGGPCGARGVRGPPPLRRAAEWRRGLMACRGGGRDGVLTHPRRAADAGSSRAGRLARYAPDSAVARGCAASRRAPLPATGRRRNASPPGPPHRATCERRAGAARSRTALPDRTNAKGAPAGRPSQRSDAERYGDRRRARSALRAGSARAWLLAGGRDERLPLPAAWRAAGGPASA